MNRNRILGCLLVVLSVLLPQPAAAAQQTEKVKTIIDKAIQAMGGDAYLGVRDFSSTGRYYVMEEDRQGWSAFTDQERLPLKVRLELGKGDEITIYDLEAGKGWIMTDKIKTATPEQMERFKRGAKHSIDNLLRFRIKEPGVTLHYFGGDTLDGRKPVEVIELIDSDNDTVRMNFSQTSGLPVRIEFQGIGKYGRKEKIWEEYSNWHEFQGIQTPLRVDRFVDGQPSSQVFTSKISYNVGLSDSLFAEPTLPGKKKK